MAGGGESPCLCQNADYFFNSRFLVASGKNCARPKSNRRAEELLLKHEDNELVLTNILVENLNIY
jgi:hypothetical protein